MLIYAMTSNEHHQADRWILITYTKYNIILYYLSHALDTQHDILYIFTIQIITGFYTAT